MTDETWEVQGVGMSTISAERLARVFVEAADTLVDDFDLVDFLHVLTVRTAELVGASAVGLLLADHRGQLRFMAASDEKARTLEIFQVQINQGPCFDAFHTAEPVINADLSDRSTRWPEFAEHALAAGFRSVHAFPLRLRQEVIGALNVFGSTVGGNFDEADVQIVQAITDVATIGLLQERAVREQHVLAQQLQTALSTRITLEQAKGVIAERSGVQMDEAFEALRAYARRNRTLLSDVAQGVIDRRIPVEDIVTRHIPQQSQE